MSLLFDEGKKASPPPKSNLPRRRFTFFVAAIFGLLLLLAATAIYISSTSFHRRIQNEIISYLEHATGGRVEMGSFQWNLSHLEFQVHNLTIHGLEAQSELPYAHVDLLLVRLRVISFLERRLALDYVGIEHPVVHLAIYPNGTTNQPHPAGKPADNEAAVRRLFEIAINRLDVSHGEALVAERQLPLDFSAADVAADMAYMSATHRYDGHLQLAKLDTKFQNWRPFASTADLHFRFYPDRIEVQSLNWSSGNSRISASGTVAQFNQPVLRADYDANLDMREWLAIARLREPASGTLTFHGRAQFGNGRYLSSGKLTLADFAYRSSSLRMAILDLRSDYRVTPEQLLLTDGSARTMGGAVSGNVSVENWARTNATAANGEQRGSARLKIANLRIRDMLDAAAASPALRKVKLSALVSGIADVTWKGSPTNAEAKLLLSASPASRVAPDELPLTARFEGSYKRPGEWLQISNLTASTRATNLQAAGTLSSSTANLKISAGTSELAELQPLFRLVSSAELPVSVRGKASFTGTIAGRRSAPQIAGHLQASDFETAFGLQHSNNAASTLQPVRWDSLSTDFQLSSTSLIAHRGSLRRGEGAIGFDGTTSLTKFKVTDSSQFSGNISVQNYPLADFENIGGYQYPVSGQVNLSLQASGTSRDLHGKGKVAVLNAVIYGQQVESVDANLLLVGREIQFSDIRAVQRRASVSGTAAFNFANAAFRFDLHGQNFDLSRVKLKQAPNLALTGRLGFNARGSGTRNLPVVNATVKLSDIIADEEKLGNFVVEAEAHGPNMQISGHSEFEKASLSLDGTVNLQGDFPADLTGRFSRLDVDPLLKIYLRGRITAHSVTDGTLRLVGPLKRPRDMEVIGDIPNFALGVEGISIHNNGPLRFAVSRQVLQLQSLRLVGNDTDIAASGTAQLAGSRRLDLDANGQLNLKIVQSLSSDYSSSGIVTVAMKVQGTMDTPHLQGQIQITNGSLNEIDLPSGLSDVNGTLVFNQNQLRVQTLTAHTGGGILTLGGYITYGSKINFNITAAGKDVRLRYPPGMSTTADVNLRLVGALTNSILSGDITVTRFALNPNLDFAAYVTRAKQPAPLPNPTSPLNNLRLDVHILTTPELQVQTSLAKITGDADLKVRGTAARPIVLGRVNITQGEVAFNGTKYRLERGDILFVKPVPPIEPVLDLEAAARVRDYDIRVGFHGPIDKLSVTYNSDPPLPTADIIALLAMGHTREETAMMESSETTFTQTASNAILGEALNSTVSNRLEKLFGVSRIKIDPQAGGAENNPTGTQVTIEQQVSNNLTLTYITPVSQAEQQIIEAEYFITRNISIVGLRDQNGVVSFDIRIRQRKN